MASLINRGGVFYGQWSDASRTPKLKRHSLKTRTRKTALRLLEAADEAAKLGQWDPWVNPISVLDTRPACPLKLSEAVAAYLSERGDSLRPQTVENYRSVLERFASHVGPSIPLARLTPSHVASFTRDAPSLARSTMRMRLASLRAFCGWGVRSGHLTESPAAKVSTPPLPPRLPKAMRADELASLVKAIREEQAARDASTDARLKTERAWLAPCFRFAFYTGLRARELAGLRWGDVDLQRRTLRLEVQKSGKASVLPLSRQAVAVLEDVDGDRDADAFVFCRPSARGERRDLRVFAGNLNRDFVRYRAAAGLPEGLTLHSTRHGFCTTLAEKGLNAFAIQAAARHASISTTQVYVSLSNQRLRDELDAAFG